LHKPQDKNVAGRHTSTRQTVQIEIARRLLVGKAQATRPEPPLTPINHRRSFFASHHASLCAAYELTSRIPIKRTAER
jgi:hypothetical protein